MKKKGTAREVLFSVLIVFACAFATLIAMKLLSSINTKWQAKAEIPDASKNFMSTMNTRMPRWMDGFIIMLWVMLILVCIFLAFQIPTSPIYFPISVIAFLGLTFVTYVFRGLYIRIAAASQLAGQSALLPMTQYLITHLHIFTFVIAVVITGLMVIKR